MAHSLGLESAELPESQDFIDSDDYCILFSEREIREGPIVDEGDRILGKHKGIVHYTIGQRRGLGIASDRPLYVKKINAENNRIVVSGKEGLYSAGFIARGFNLIAVDRLDRPYKVRAKIRLKHEEAEAAIFPHGEDKVKVLFDEPQVAVTPGQSAVLYSGDTVFGGGIIEKAL